MNKEKQVEFTAMEGGSLEDDVLLAGLERPFVAMTADRILDELSRTGEQTVEGIPKHRAAPFRA